MGKNYDKNSIKTLSARESIRESIGRYIGGSDLNGRHQLFTEAIANSIDEAVAGFGKLITVNIDTATNKLSIEDHGRGIPFGINKEGKDAIVEATCNLHGGGKFVGQEGYKSSLGLHGLGLKCIHYLSSSFHIRSCRGAEGICDLSFDANDKQAGPTITTPSHLNQERGTLVEFIPDSRIFLNGVAPLKWDKDIIADKRQTYALLNNNITFELKVNGATYKKFLYTDGIKDLLAIKVGKTKCITDPTFYKCDVDRASNSDGENYHAYFEFGLIYTDQGVEHEYCYANGGETPNGGTYLTGFKSAYTTLINKLAKDIGLERKFNGDMIRRGLVLVRIRRADFRLQFAEQTKLTLNSPEARTLASKAAAQITFDKKTLKNILDKISTEQKAEDAAQRKREAQAKILHGGKNLNSLRDRPEKLNDASDFTDAEIFFCEGDSAAGGACETKNPSQAVLPLRGKILNTCGRELADITKSSIIKDILTCLGCGIGDNFNIKNLRYNRIIIRTDSDPDGNHIELLLCTLFLYHLPQLIEQGKVYTVASPIYKVKDSRGNILYFYTEKEAQKWFRTHSGFKALHIKGLGEMNPEELYDTTLNPTHRHLIRLTTESLTKTLQLYNVLMGSSPLSRRQFILDNKPSKAAISTTDDVDMDAGDGAGDGGDSSY